MRTISAMALNESVSENISEMEEEISEEKNKKGISEEKNEKVVNEKENNDSQQSETVNVNEDIDLEVDLGTLLVSNYHALNTKDLKSEPESYLKILTKNNVQLLINKIWELPMERVDETVVAVLPKPEYVLPRSQPIPKPKPLTKWQQFAKEKGIQNKKKSKLKWDEQLKKWVPTYGYKRAKAEKEKQWLIEVNDNQNPNDDQFSKTKKSKVERQSKNELQRLHNIAKSKNIKVPRIGVMNEHLPNSQKLMGAMTVARVSTASLGKFQSKLPKEKDAKGIIGKKRKSAPLNIVDEKRQNTGLVDNILKSQTKILRDDYSSGTTEVKQSTVRSKKKKTDKTQKKSKTAKKPKAGKGERNLHKKVGGRKRR